MEKITSKTGDKMAPLFHCCLFPLNHDEICQTNERMVNVVSEETRGQRQELDSQAKEKG